MNRPLAGAILCLLTFIQCGGGGGGGNAGTGGQTDPSITWSASTIGTAQSSLDVTPSQNHGSNLAICYVDGNHNNALFERNGNTWTTDVAFPFKGTTLVRYFKPVATFDKIGGLVAVALRMVSYDASTNSYTYQLESSRRNAGIWGETTPVSNPFVIINWAILDSTWAPQIVVDGNNRVTVIWPQEEVSGKRYQVSTSASGGPWSVPMPLGISGSLNSWFPFLNGHADGSTLLAWKEQPSNLSTPLRAFIKILPTNSNTWAEAEEIPPFKSVVSNSANSVCIFTNDGTGHIYYQDYVPGTLGAAQLLEPDPPPGGGINGEVDGYSYDMAPDGSIIAAWVYLQTKTIRARIRTNGTWGTKLTLTLNPTPFSIRTAIASKDSANIIYFQGTNSGEGLFSAAYHLGKWGLPSNIANGTGVSTGSLSVSSSGVYWHTYTVSLSGSSDMLYAAVGNLAP